LLLSAMYRLPRASSTQPCGRSRPAAAVAARTLAAARNGGDDAGLRVDLADGVVLGIDDVHVAERVAANALGPAEHRPPSRPTVTAGAGLARPRNGSDEAASVHLADGIALAFADIGIALAVHAYRPRADHDGLRRRAAVADGCALDFAFRASGAGEGGDDAGLQIQPADPPIGHVGDQQSPLAVQAAIIGLAQHGRGARAAVAAVALRAVACDRH
jgi:hypothetical protein